jgi:hypothetical protein
MKDGARPSYELRIEGVLEAQRGNPGAAAVPLGFLVRLQRAFDASAETPPPGQVPSPREINLIEP